MGSLRRALVIGNGDDFDPGFVGHRLRHHGFAFTELHRDRAEHWAERPAGPRDVELVLTLGSEWNVYRHETAAHVEAEAELLREVVDRRTPLFAICFGAQVLSHALGGKVERMGEPEIGWRDIELDRASTDGVATGPWMQWHYDSFTVPDGFQELGRNPFGPQLAVGDRAVATQFHPEVTESMVHRWLGMGGEAQLREGGLDPDELRTATRANVVASRARADDLVDWFLARIAGD